MYGRLLFGLKILPLMLVFTFSGIGPNHAQEMLGVSNGNHAGVNSSVINPANMGYQPQYLYVYQYPEFQFTDSLHSWITRKTPR